MKKIVLFTLIMLLSGGIVWAKDYEIQKKAGDLSVVVKMDRNPAVIGENGVSVMVKDSAGKEVTDAGVKIEYSMPAMPGMPAMNYGSILALSKNTYQGKLNFSMSGPWNIVVKIVRSGKAVSTKFSVDVQ
ncbi:MAG: FixH family protein [Desulfobulbaceae bacterium]|nr:FixH family protein [Desulfobulbaceae bacterium]HIJ90481.1 FixH family protein [Deltaproteobacteria bacterium]